MNELQKFNPKEVIPIPDHSAEIENNTEFYKSEVGKKLWADVERMVGDDINIYTQEHPFEKAITRSHIIKDSDKQSRSPINLGAKVSIYAKREAESQLIFLEILYITARHKVIMPVEIILKKIDAMPSNVYVNSKITENIMEKIHTNLLEGLSNI